MHNYVKLAHECLCFIILHRNVELQAPKTKSQHWIIKLSPQLNTCQFFPPILYSCAPVGLPAANVIRKG